MKRPNIIITEADYAELVRLLEAGAHTPREREEMDALEAELERAEIVSPDEIPPQVITMNSRAELLDVKTGERMEFTVVFPRDANIDVGKISILAPIGTGMLGHAVVAVFDQPAPTGVRRLKVTHVKYQPEAALAAI